MANESGAAPPRVVTVFGSSRVHVGDEEYTAAQQLGRLLAERGWTLCNGGHDGTMEAASRGAKEQGGRTIGVSFARYPPARVNPWLDQEILAETLFARLEQLVTLGDAFVVLRGGIGTLLELALVWNLVQSPEFSTKPIVVVGESWASVIGASHEWLPMRDDESHTLLLVPTVDDAIDRLQEIFARHTVDPAPTLTETPPARSG